MESETRLYKNKEIEFDVAVVNEENRLTSSVLFPSKLIFILYYCIFAPSCLK
jgi:hypothetical protein